MLRRIVEPQAIAANASGIGRPALMALLARSANWSVWTRSTMLRSIEDVQGLFLETCVLQRCQ